jgi:glucose/mannose transport system substrate-binding protein
VSFLCSEPKARFKLRRYLHIATIVLSTGCSARVIGSVNEEPAGQVSGEFDIRTWWVSPSETSAFFELFGAFQRQNPKVSLLQSSRSADEQRASLWADVKTDPPDTFPCLLGAGCVFRFVHYNDVDTADSPFIKLDELAQRYEWERKFSGVVLEGAKVDGSIYALPSNVHRINTVLYNIPLFEKYQLSIPRTLSELYSACETLKQHNEKPIAGADSGWTISMLVFDNLFPAVANGDVELTRRFLRGESVLGAEDPAFLATLEEAVKLFAYVDTVPNDDWSRATSRVRTGDAAMIFMGDWAQGDMLARDSKYGEDFGVFPTPGAGNVFVFNSDAFPLVAGAKHPDIAEAWLKFIASPENQILFNGIKGGIPALALTPSDLPATDRYGRETLASFNDPNVVKAGALSTVLPFEFEESLNTVMQKFARDHDPGPVKKLFRDNYSELFQKLHRRSE